MLRQDRRYVCQMVLHRHNIGPKSLPEVTRQPAARIVGVGVGDDHLRLYLEKIEETLDHLGKKLSRRHRVEIPHML